MFTLMNDPVILPKSQITIDRATIKSHLLSDNTDPFNRSPLKLEDVVPSEYCTLFNQFDMILTSLDDDLRAKILEFRRIKSHVE